MWKLSRNRVLLDEHSEEEDVLRGAPLASAATPAPVRARVGAQVRAAGCSREEVQVDGVARRARSCKGPDASRGLRGDSSWRTPLVSGRIPQVLGPRASLCGVPRDAHPGHFPHWPATLPFALLLQRSRVRPETPGMRGDRFQARCFYSGVGETQKS